MFKITTNINFMGQRHVALIVSALLIVISIGSLATRGLNLGIDFTGGTGIELGYTQVVDLDQVRGQLEQAGYHDVSAQHVDGATNVLIHIPLKGEMDLSKLSNEVLRLLRETSGDDIVLRSVDFVGPKVGEELREQGGLAMVYALIGILIYVTLRFEFRFSLGSIVALIHDVIITLGCFSLTLVKFDLAVLAAILAVIGYSLNDTIVVYDRIRENFRKIRKATTREVINTSINQTLSRTLVTSLTTLLVLLALFFVGGESIHGFAMALIIGVVVGTYSSVYVASSSLLLMKVSKADLMPVKKEGEGLEDRP